MFRNLRTLKLLVVAFWAAWYSIVTASNVTDGLKAAGWLSAQWPFASGNYAAVVKTTAIYYPPGWLNVVLFTGVILWELLAAGLFWRAAILWRRRPKDH